MQSFKPQRSRSRSLIQPIKLHQMHNGFHNLVPREVEFRLVDLPGQNIVQHAAESADKDADSGPASEA